MNGELRVGEKIQKAELEKFQENLQKAKVQDRHRGRNSDIKVDGIVGPQMYRMAERLIEETGQMQEQMNRDARALHIRGITPDGKLGPQSVELDKAITEKKKPAQKTSDAGKQLPAPAPVV
jgi:hypothetical protein